MCCRGLCRWRLLVPAGGAGWVCPSACAWLTSSHTRHSAASHCRHIGVCGGGGSSSGGSMRSMNAHVWKKGACEVSAAVFSAVCCGPTQLGHKYVRASTHHAGHKATAQHLTTTKDGTHRPPHSIASMRMASCLGRWSMAATALAAVRSLGPAPGCCCVQTCRQCRFVGPFSQSVRRCLSKLAREDIISLSA